MYSHSLRLDPFDILRLVAVPGEPGVFALPTRDRPTRIVSQQRRALTLAHALLESQASAGTKPYEIRLAVVGGGFGGVTAALYAAQAGMHVTLFEREGELLQRFNGSTRDIHPTIADWPADTWFTEEAGLRILDWRARKSAGELAQDARTTVKRASAITNLEVHRGAEVKLLPPGEAGAPRRLMWSADERMGTGVFDAIIVATGFGEERKPQGWGSEDLGYWKSDKTLTDADRTVAVIGNGDGALMEIVRLLGVEIKDHADHVRRMLAGPGELVTARLREHEARWRFERDTSGRAGDRASVVSKTYFDAVEELHLEEGELPKPLHPELQQIYVFGRSTDLLTLDAYAVNRLLVALLLRPVDGRASGRYVSRHPDHRVALDYICADAVIEQKELGLYRIRAMPPGSSTGSGEKTKWGVVKVNAVIPRLGPEPPRDEWAALAVRGSEDGLAGKTSSSSSVVRQGRINASQLNLLERNVPTHVLERARDLGSWPTLASEPGAASEASGDPGRRQRLRFGSEFYDTYIQKLARDVPDVGIGIVYVGKLRFDTLLWNTVILPDAQILDGCFFHSLDEPRWASLKPILSTPGAEEDRARVAIHARAEKIEDALAQFIAGTRKEPRKVPPELSAAPSSSPLPPLDLRDGEWSWETIHGKLKSAGGATAEWLEKLGVLVARIEPHWKPNFEPWTKSFYVIPSLDVFDTLKDVEEAIFRGLEKEVGPALRGRKVRTEVFEGIRTVTGNDPLVEEGKLSEFVAWYNSSYNLGIFHGAKADAGEFLWIPTKSGRGEDAERIGDLCMVCLGSMKEEDFTAVRKRVRERRDLRGRLERAVDVLKPSCAHVPVPEGTSVAKMLRLWGGRISVQITSTGWRYVSGSGKAATVLSRVEFTE